MLSTGVCVRVSVRVSVFASNGERMAREALARQSQWNANVCRLEVQLFLVLLAVRQYRVEVNALKKE